jgi:hypothetical protein
LINSKNVGLSWGVKSKSSDLFIERNFFMG